MPAYSRSPATNHPPTRCSHRSVTLVRPTTSFMDYQ
jgi:hypothetical protein